MPGDFGIVGAAVTALRSVFSFRRPDLEVCKTRIVREGAGFPWDRQIAIHRREDGKIDMKAIKAPQ